MSKLGLIAYQRYAQRTLPDLGNVEDNMMHMSLGLITEVGELTDAFKRKLAYKKDIDIVNCAEEIGDILWYTVNGLTLINHNITFAGKLGTMLDSESKYEYPLNALTTIIALNNVVADISSVVCVFKEEGLGDEFKVSDFKMPFENILKICNGLCSILNLDIEEIMFKNIEKLRVRFPDKFSEEAALNRDLEKERSVLEKGE